MSKERFLLYTLAGIFVVQASIFIGATVYCAKSGGLKACPELNKRFDQTFEQMISVTLALLVGSSMKE